MVDVRALTLAGLFTASVLISPAAAPTSRELVYFTSGGVIPVTGHRTDGDDIVLVFHGDAEVRFDPTLIDRIELDPNPRYSTRLARVESYQTYVKSRLLSKPYEDVVQQASEAHGVDPFLIHSVIETESNYSATARSSRGAMGLMQLMPAIATEYALEDPYDPQTNIDAGTRHLGRLIERYGIANGLAAYNAGEGSVRRFNGIPPYPETRRYITRILDLVDANQAN